MNMDTDDWGLRLHELAVEFNLTINVEVNFIFNILQKFKHKIYYMNMNSDLFNTELKKISETIQNLELKEEGESKS